MSDAPQQTHAPKLGASINFRDWQLRIQKAPDKPELLELIREYLAGWQPAELKMLPIDVASTAIERSEDIVARAVIATREELQYQGGEHGHRLLREMALTFGAAANRLRYLQALGGRPLGT